MDYAQSRDDFHMSSINFKYIHILKQNEKNIARENDQNSERSGRMEIVWLFTQE